MAEILGIVSSGAGLASLSGQLLASGQALKGFSRDYKHAPKLLETLSFDCQTLSMMLREVETYRQQSDEPIDELLERCTFRLQGEVQTIESCVNKLRERLRKSRVRGKLWTAFQDPEIRKGLDCLESAKSMLWPALQIYIDRRRARDSREHQQAIIARLDRLPSADQQVVEVMDCKPIHDRHSSMALADDVFAAERDVDNALVKDYSLSSRSSLDCQHAKSNMPKMRKMDLTVEFPTWLSKRVWSIAILQASWGFDWSLHTWVEHSTSPAFQYCRNGDLIVVREMISNGEVGPRDTDRGNFTLLDTAAIKGHVDICIFLMNRCRLAMDTEAVSRALTVLGFNFHNWLRRIEQYREMFSFFVERSAIEYDGDESPSAVATLPRWLLASPDIQILRSALRSRLGLNPATLGFKPNQILDLDLGDFWRVSSPEVLLWFFNIEWSTVGLIDLSFHVKQHILHITAARIGSLVGKSYLNSNIEPSCPIGRWYTLARDMVLAGAKPAALADGITALARMWVNVVGPRYPYDGFWGYQGQVFDQFHWSLRRWVAAMHCSGIDAAEYGELERKAWVYMRARGEPKGRWRSLRWGSIFQFHRFEIHDLVWGSSPSDWSFTVSRKKTVAVWERFPMPGSWKDCSHSSLTKNDECLQNELQQAGWMKVRRISIASKPFDARQLPHELFNDDGIPAYIFDVP